MLLLVLAWDFDHLTSASQVAEITGVNHHTHLLFVVFNDL
jgi:hypothetical protein